jgi:phosphopantothenoylcysteine decarboxylase/phosphopantothenate--cysteine ligase
MLNKPSVLLIISGGIAAYKTPELVRLFKRSDFDVSVILTKSAEQFVTPLTLQTVSENKVFTDLFSLDDEHEIGHIQLSRKADVVLVAPATANILAEMAQGLCRDLATTCLLATDKPVIVAPAMNIKMWEHPATQANLEMLKQRGITIMQPNEGSMACGEFGIGRLPEPQEIFGFVTSFLSSRPTKRSGYISSKDMGSLDFARDDGLKGKSAIVTAGPTHEPIDPVRFIGNYSSGKQGYAIAQKLAEAGATVTLISGPTSLPTPANVTRIDVQTAEQMKQACENALHADIAICTAAVADWKVDIAARKIKKTGKMPMLNLKENPDILKTISQHKNRPALVVGFAAETENLEQNATAKRHKKGCDWIVANEISQTNPAFGADQNSCTLFTKDATEIWESQSKVDIAQKLVEKVALFFYDSNKSIKEKDIA